MKTTKEIQINGNKYEIGMFGPDDGDEILIYLAKAAGPVMMAFAGGLDKDVLSPEIGKALSGALANVSGREHAQFMRKALSVCTINGSHASEIYDAHFIGNHGERYKAVVEVIKHNDFFAVVAELIKAKST